MSENTHPKAIEAAERSAERRAQRATMQKYVKEAAKKGLRFLEEGNTTICYRKDGRNVVSISTAIRHPTDHKDRLTGRFTAMQRLYAGNCIQLKSWDQNTVMFVKRILFVASA